MSTAPRRVSASADVDRVVEILASAFNRDPLWAWAFPDDAKRLDQHRWFWRHFAQAALRYDDMWLDATGNATALWVPPGGEEMTAAEGAHLGSEMASALSLEEIERVGLISAALDKAHCQSEPHYFLTLLGTDYTALGRGLGLGLLRDTLTVVDAAELPAYLEASNPGNVALYARYGFEVCAEILIGGGAPDVFGMWRTARSKP